MEEELIALLTLLQMEGLGGRQIRKLRRQWGSLEELWSPFASSTLPPSLQMRLSALSELRKQAETILSTCDRLGIAVIPYYDNRFPPLLEEIPSPPAVLYKKGPHSLTEQPLVAVVGTRKPSAYGMKATETFVEALVAAGVGIVSGLAYGIDAHAHRVTLEKKGKTIAVLAHGLDRIYPSIHRRLADAILAEGAWVSEYPPGTKLHPLLFPYRNRIIGGLAHLTLIVESREKGGALFTARAAFEANRPVFAVPGSIFSPVSQGPHLLIAEQIAHIASSPTALIEELKVQTQRLPLPPSSSEKQKVPLHPLHAEIYALLLQGQKHIDEICIALGRSVVELIPHLLQMEIEGWIQQKPGGFICREAPPDAKF
ncbi:MAG: DNA-processing protein DprA [Bacteroidia bacterium]|nr:DNA-processing protein DprA [Bacteroidia bacterium]MDW8015167.1 DNA-processing protein DprA [Bacteroidia bacterium]